MVATMTQPEKTLEQIVCETGRYPVEGFVFVQECIGAAADAVHGPPSPEMERVAQYMTRKNISLEELRQRYEDGDLPAWLTLLLDRIGGPEKLNRHVTGQQLCWAIRDTALKRWGLLARQVLAHWGITRTEDIGRCSACATLCCTSVGCWVEEWTTMSPPSCGIAAATWPSR